MGADEVETLQALTRRRAILDGLIAAHRGRIANTAGDSVLAEFGSAVDAVQCAVEAQGALAEANQEMPPDRHIKFRIGVHVGDVMVKAGDLFGDGVNIAARLQSALEDIFDLQDRVTASVVGAQGGEPCTYHRAARRCRYPVASLGGPLRRRTITSRFARRCTGAAGAPRQTFDRPTKSISPMEW